MLALIGLKVSHSKLNYINSPILSFLPSHPPLVQLRGKDMLYLGEGQVQNGKFLKGKGIKIPIPL